MSALGQKRTFAVGINGVRAFKALRKFALQKYGLRAVTVRQEQAKDAAS
jgi:hypothetical protein